MNNTYKINYEIKYSEVDSFYKLRLDHIFLHFENIADLHSKEMKTDGEVLLKKSNVFWVLTKMKLKIADFPRSGETITVETWPLKAKGVRYDRDFCLCNADKPLVMGSSEWCTLDYTSHKLRRVDSVAYPQDMQFRDDRSGAGEFLRAKEAVCDTDLHHTYRSSFVDIDTNKHTNNVAYLRMVLNCFSPDEFELMKMDEFQINFLSQTFYGDEIKIYKKKVDNGFYIEGKCNETTVFNCIILVENI
ncbi:MAG: hypothetical protein IJZ75_00840 [Clostridia bacterium]|nr:hypothetical protein [Clostridia bacterium]